MIPLPEVRVMKAVFKEIKKFGLTVWVCELNGQVIAQAFSLQGCKLKVLQIVRKFQYV